MDEPAQRQVDLRDLVEVEVLAQAPEALEVLFGEHHGHRTPQAPPAPTVELDVRRVVAGVSAHGSRLWQVATGEGVSGWRGTRLTTTTRRAVAPHDSYEVQSPRANRVGPRLVSSSSV